MCFILFYFFFSLLLYFVYEFIINIYNNSTSSLVEWFCFVHGLIFRT